MKPSLASVHANAALTDVAIAYRNSAYVADQVFPVVPVAKESDYYFIWTQADIFRSEATKVRPGALAPRGGFGLSSTTYTVDEWGYAWKIPDRVRANMDPAVSAELNATMRVMDQILLAREINVIKQITSTSWTNSLTITGDNWDTGGGDPLLRFDVASNAIQAAVGVPPNTVLLPYKTYRALRRHPDIAARMGIASSGGGAPNPISYGPAIITPQVLAAILDIPRILVCSALYNSAAEGQTASYSPVMGDYVFVCYVPPAPAIDAPACGYTFRHGGPRVRTYRDEAAESDVVEARERYATKITANTAGYLLTDALSV